jgi:hypothetical protein
MLVIFFLDEMQVSSISFLKVLIWCYTFLLICFSYDYNYNIKIEGNSYFQE